MSGIAKLFKLDVFSRIMDVRVLWILDIIWPRYPLTLEPLKHEGVGCCTYKLVQGLTWKVWPVPWAECIFNGLEALKYSNFADASTTASPKSGPMIQTVSGHLKAYSQILFCPAYQTQ